MTYFLQRLAERAMGHRTGARPVLTPYIAPSLAVGEKSVWCPSSEPPSSKIDGSSPAVQRQKSMPPEASAMSGNLSLGKDCPVGVPTPQGLVAADFLSPNPSVEPTALSYGQQSLEDRPASLVLPGFPAPSEEQLVERDNRDPEQAWTRKISRAAPRRPIEEDELLDLSGDQYQTKHSQTTAKPAVAARIASSLEFGKEPAAHSATWPGEVRPSTVFPELVTDVAPWGENQRSISGEIEPLLPLSPRAQDPMPGAVPQRSSGHQSQTTTGDNTEIHITIGRVEVTALYPGQAEKAIKPAAARRSPMSLDEYLAKRHGRVS